MFDLRLLRIRSFTTANSALALIGTAMGGALFLLVIFLVSVLASALAFGLAPAVTAAAAAAQTYNFFFLEPRLSFVIGHAADVLTFVVFFAVALTTGWLIGRVRDQGLAMSRRASAVTALLAASRTLSASAKQEETAQALAEQLAAATGGEAIVLLPAGDDVLPVAALIACASCSGVEVVPVPVAPLSMLASSAGVSDVPGTVF